MRGSCHGYSMYSDEGLKEWIMSNIYSISYSKLLSMQAAQIKTSTLDQSKANHYMYTFHGLYPWASDAGVSNQIQWTSSNSKAVNTVTGSVGIKI